MSQENVSNNANINMVETADFEIDIRAIFNMLKRRKDIIIGIVGVVVAISLIGAFIATPIYSAKSLLRINTNSNKVVDIESVMSGVSADASLIQTELDVLKSRRLVGRVLDSLELIRNPEFNANASGLGFIGTIKSWFGVSKKAQEDAERIARIQAINNILGNLNITTRPRSYTISVSFKSESAKTSALIANAIVDEYLDDQLETKFEATKRANKWLNDRLKELRTKVRHSDLAVQKFKEENNLQEAQGITLNEQQLSELNSQIIIAQTNRTLAEAKLKRAKELIANSGDAESAVYVINSPLIQRLKEQEAEVLRTVSKLKDRYGKKHPRMINIRNEVREIRSKIKSEIKNITLSLSNDVDVSKTREQVLRDSLKQLEGANTFSSRAEIKLSELVRDRDANKALFEVFLARFKETSQSIDFAEADARVISYADIPLSPRSPNKKFILLIAIFMGLGLGVAVAMILEHLDNGFRSTEHLERISGVASIGAMPLLENEADISKYAITKITSAFSEALRSVLTAVHFSNPDAIPRVVMVTSSVPKEGKSTFSASLARVTAKSGAKVLLIDCDMRRPSVAKSFNIQPKAEATLSSIIAGEATEKEVIHKDKASGLHIIASLPNTPNSQDILGSQSMKDFLKAQSEKYDLVVLDTPPVMAVSDSHILTSIADATIFVVRWQETPRDVVMASMKKLRSCNAKLAGTVLSQVDMDKSKRFGYDTYYGQYKDYYTD